MDFEWSRGAVIGVGSCSTVSLAHVRLPYGVRRHLPPVMAVKSAPLAHSAILRHEHSVLSDLQGCPHVVRCFGYEVAADDTPAGAASCNLFLEYVSGGSLRDVLRRSCGGSLREPSIRRYARSILRGLTFAHARGYAHCDIKPQNILVDGGSGGTKIADFGLAIKLRGNTGAAAGVRGTPLYIAPESAARGELGAAADVWSTGCVVAEMASGRPPWRHSGDVGNGEWENLLFRIGYGDEVPEIPSELSAEGKDFLRRCFVKDPAKRWTVEMLLLHPFVASEEEQINAASAKDLYDQYSWSMKSSPGSVIGLLQWVSPRSLFGSVEVAASDSSVLSSTPADRIKELAGSQRPNWSDDGRWIDVRAPDAKSPQEESKINSNEDGRRRVDELMEFNNVEFSGRVELVLPSLLFSRNV